MPGRGRLPPVLRWGRMHAVDGRVPLPGRVRQSAHHLINDNRRAQLLQHPSPRFVNRAAMPYLYGAYRELRDDPVPMIRDPGRRDKEQSPGSVPQIIPHSVSPCSGDQMHGANAGIVCHRNRSGVNNSPRHQGQHTGIQRGLGVSGCFHFTLHTCMLIRTPGERRRTVSFRNTLCSSPYYAGSYSEERGPATVCTASVLSGNRDGDAGSPHSPMWSRAGSFSNTRNNLPEPQISANVKHAKCSRITIPGIRPTLFAEV